MQSQTLEIGEKKSHFRYKIGNITGIDNFEDSQFNS